jgi:hypothetical protein
VLEINLPEVVAELEAMFDRYERALVGNDIEGLNALFWDSGHTLRYGVRELLYSHAEIAEFRRARGPIDQRRTLRNTRITSFGRDFATAHTEFLPVAGERAGQVGRQSQTWIRTPQGWKISSAHVSFVA